MSQQLPQQDERTMLLLSSQSSADSSSPVSVSESTPSMMWSSCRHFLQSHIPALQWIPNYHVRADLPSDIIAGITLTTLILPQSMAYATLAGLPPQMGLYSSVVCIAIFSLLATSRHVNVGTFALSSLLFHEAIQDLWPEASSTNSNITLPVTFMFSFCIGVVQIFFGFVKLGHVIHALLTSSEALIAAFVSASAFHIVASQWGPLFGINIPDQPQDEWPVFDLGRKYSYVFTHTNLINGVEIALGISSMIVMYIIKRYISPRFQKYANTAVPIPEALIVVIITSLMCYTGDWHIKHNVHIVGNVPAGLPTLDTNVISHAFSSTIWNESTMSAAWIVRFIFQVIVLAVVCSIMTLAISIKFSKQFDYSQHLDSNQELIALGMSSAFGSFFKCYVSCGSLSRSAVLAEAQGKTNLANLIQVLVVMIVLVGLTPLLYYICKSVLAAVIVVAFFSIFSQLAESKKFLNRDILEFVVWLSTLLFVIVLDVEYGLFASVGLSLIISCYRMFRPVYGLVGTYAAGDSEPSPSFFTTLSCIHPLSTSSLLVNSHGSASPALSVKNDNNNNNEALRLQIIDNMETSSSLAPVKFGFVHRWSNFQHYPDVRIFRISSPLNVTIASSMYAKFLELTHTESNQPVPFKHIILDAECWGDSQLDEAVLASISSFVIHYQSQGIRVFVCSCKGVAQQQLAYLFDTAAASGNNNEVACLVDSIEDALDFVQLQP